MRRILIFLAVGYGAIVCGCASMQRKLLYFPTHRNPDGRLEVWRADNGEIIGFDRQVPCPVNVWLMLHGNAGQAEDRAYALPCFSGADSVFILEYPGYGMRPGRPSKDAFDAAAAAAYLRLRKSFPGKPVCVLGESIGSGPACSLASQPVPPDKIVLVVPFDRLADVAADHFPFLPIRWILGDNWDNVAALSAYHGAVEIFGAQQDNIIPIRHAAALAQAVPATRFHQVTGGHNDWSQTGEVFVRNP